MMFLHHLVAFTLLVHASATPCSLGGTFSVTYTVNGTTISKAAQPGAFMHDSEDVLIVLLGPDSDSKLDPPKDGFLLVANPCFDVGCQTSHAVLNGSYPMLNATEHFLAPALNPRNATAVFSVAGNTPHAGLQEGVVCADKGKLVVVDHNTTLSGSVSGVQMSGLGNNGMPIRLTLEATFVDLPRCGA